jgi:hypothetical protein
MKKDEMLTLPENWETVMERMMLYRPSGINQMRVYICSPCRANTAEDVIRNMKAARVYMFYAHIYFRGIPIAPHAYVPILLHDDFEDERLMALRFGFETLRLCDNMLVCGGRLSEGMYGEIKEAARLNIPVRVFSSKVHSELCGRLEREGIDSEYLSYEDGHLHYALSLGADELAFYWGDDGND